MASAPLYAAASASSARVMPQILIRDPTSPVGAIHYSPFLSFYVYPHGRFVNRPYGLRQTPFRFVLNMAQV